MSNPYQLPPPVTAEPKHRFFDPWNSSSTGHQKVDSRLAGSTSWRDSRSLKLSNQFGGGASGGARLADTVGAGSEDFGKDGRLDNGSWAKGAPGLRSGSQMSVVEAFRIRKVGVKDTPTEKAKAKIMVNRGKEQELDLLDIPSAQPVPQHSSQDQDPASSHEDELLRETQVLMDRGARPTKIRIQKAPPHGNLLRCLRGSASISMAARLRRSRTTRKLFCQHENCNNHKKNPFKRPEYLVAHVRAIHGGQPSDSHDAVIQDGLKATTTASELKSNEETPWHRYRRSGPEEGCQNPPGEHIKTQIEAVQAESSSIRTIFNSLGVEIQSLKTQLSQIQTKANNLSIGS